MDAKARRAQVIKRSKDLKGHCHARGLGEIDSEAKRTALGEVVAQWLAGPGADLAPVERVYCIKALFDGDRALAVKHPLSFSDRTQWQLWLIGQDPRWSVPSMPDSG